ncbi:MAG TPA: type II 3-dehydroquinate dehydratase [Crocinitomix sp.]|nr:type II 3-dehydroquinate dehydratase [Crocinitomix sp.]
MNAKQILILNGPNLNLVGKREPETYGVKSFKDYYVDLEQKFPQLRLNYLQTNYEGELVTQIQNLNNKYSGIVLNAGGYTHTSVAIRDAIKSTNIPVIEVHISNISNRESFRHESLISPVCSGSILGFGLKGYELALNWFI